MDDMSRSCSLVLEESWWKWPARGEGPGDMGVWARPGFLGGMGGGWPLSPRGMMGDFIPGESGLDTLAGGEAGPEGGQR